MKQITPEIKARVFALYWGQEILAYKHWGQIVTGNEIDCWALSRNENYLEVKPLSSITDEDAITLPNGYHKTRKELIDYYCEYDDATAIRRFFADLKPVDYDHLRSLGYALPAFGYSVDELVGAGVFKIKEVNHD